MTSLTEHYPEKQEGNLFFRTARVEEALLVEHLFKEHWEATGRPIFMRGLNYDINVAKMLEANGNWIATKVVTGEGEIVGYCAGSVTNHLFMQDIRLVTICMFFVKNEYRHLQVAKTLLEFTEEYAKDMFGAEYFSIGFTGESAKVAPLLKGIGYQQLDITMIKSL